MYKKLFVFSAALVAIISLLITTSCSKDLGAKPTYRPASLAGTWAKEEPYYYPSAEYLDSGATSWRSFIGFAFTSDGEPDVLGFYNPYVVGKGTNCLGMNTIYATTANLSSDSGTYNVQAPKCFKFVADAANPKVGKVLVMPQIIKLTSKKVMGIRTIYNISIAPTTTEGTFNLDTKTFEVDVMFDDRPVGGPQNKIRKYRFSTL